MNKYPQTVSAVFFDRLKELISGRSGAALAITLSFVMPIYLMVIGVYGIGEVVRNKIEIQNAADAAAYSAAVVQADYLSRIATVNKAMAWTYVDLQKRSLDLAMDSFLVKVLAKYGDRVSKCMKNNKPCHMHVPGANWNVGTDYLDNKTILRFTGTGFGIPALLRKLNGQGTFTRFVPVPTYHVSAAQFKGKGTIANEPKVLKYSYNLLAMSKKIYDLRNEYSQKIKEAAQQIAIANMMECKDDYFVKVDTGDLNKIFFFMLPTEEYEKKFIGFADPTLKDTSPKKVFGRGTDVWIKRSSVVPVGFSRVYKQTDDLLYAEWDWFWTKWVHIPMPPPFPSFHLPPFFGGDCDSGTDKIYGKNVTGIIANDFPIGLVVAPAEPIILTPLFFGKAGTITVAIIRKTANPLSMFAGGFNKRSLTAPGILSAFNPSVKGGKRPEYMCAISSARAGFKQYNSDKTAKLDGSDYSVGYAESENNWNLVETDWDAMMLPVKKAWSQCMGTDKIQFFMLDNSDILKEMFLNKNNWIDSNGKSVQANNLPDWDKLEPPGGLIVGKNSKERKLDWVKLRDYLGH